LTVSHPTTAAAPSAIRSDGAGSEVAAAPATIHLAAREARRQPPETPLKDLLQLASKDLSLLVKKEVDLAKAELQVAAKDAAKGAVGLVVAAVLALGGSIMALFTIAEALNEFLPRPLAFLITALLFFLLAGVAALVGLKRVKKVKGPQRTMTTVKDDIAWAKHPTSAPTVVTGS